MLFVLTNRLTMWKNLSLLEQRYGLLMLRILTIRTKSIYQKKKKLLTHDYYINRFKEEFQFIREETKRVRQDLKTPIIITHHKPPQRGDFISFITEQKVPCWLYGHTHYSSSEYNGSTLVVSNQWGYPQLGEDPWKSGFFSEFVVDIDSSTHTASVVMMTNKHDDYVKHLEQLEEIEFERKRKEKQNSAVSTGQRGGPVKRGGPIQRGGTKK